MGFVDLHAHVLAAVDDGAPDLATGSAMLRGLHAVGFERVCATPHQKSAQFLPALDAIQRAHADLVAQGPQVAVSLAAENFWDEVFHARWKDGSFPRYDGGRAFLFEIHPQEIPVRFEENLFQFAVRGFLPVMAHPERYRGFYGDLDRLRRIGAQVALVVDLGALAGYHGWKAGRVARRLVADRIAHAAASDVHSPEGVRAAAEGIAWIRKKLGEAAVNRLLADNPRCILAGELPEP